MNKEKIISTSIVTIATTMVIGFHAYGIYHQIRDNYIINEENKKQIEIAIEEKENDTIEIPQKKIEEIPLETKEEETIEEEMSLEESVAYSIANDKDFVNKYNRMVTLYNDCNDVLMHKSKSYMSEKHGELEDIWVEETIEELNSMELTSSPALDKLRSDMKMDLKFSYGHDDVFELMQIINKQLGNNW